MARKERIILGLNSGTSADGVDAVACQIVGRGESMQVRYLGHVSLSFPAPLRKRLLAAMAPASTFTEEICDLDRLIGAQFADSAALAKRRLSLNRIDFVGSHGQTICHLPPRGRRSSRTACGSTMQIGDPAVISLRMKCPVVHHFRQADMAAGGQGAPLIPWTDHVLFKDRRRTRVIQNIGGIANLTLLPAAGRRDDVIAFDCGPGNMLIDALIDHFSNGRRSFDRDGKLAARGEVNRAVLTAMVQHPFLRLMPPRSCGREEFGVAWMHSLLRHFRKQRLRAEGWVATATAFTAITIAEACALAQRISGKMIDEMILCGGGANNLTLVSLLRREVSVICGHSVELTRPEDYGIPSQAKEGVGFAMLAAACVDRVPANLPSVTGAKESVVIGQICDVRPHR